MNSSQPDIPPPRICSQSKCKRCLPPLDQYSYKTCEKCREQARRAKQKRQQREQAARMSTPPSGVAQDLDPCSPTTASSPEVPVHGRCDGPAGGKPLIMYNDVHEVMAAIRDGLKTELTVFHVGFLVTTDPLVTDRERVQMLALEVWKVSGYRFKVHEHVVLNPGYKTRYWCCQDEARKAKAKPITRAGAKHRDNVGMDRFLCESGLVITCKAEETDQRLVTIKLKHVCPHVHYYDVDMPSAAADIIREGLEWSTPNEMVSRVQTYFPNVTAAQIHSAWTRMSEVVWKRDINQLTSAKILMSEFPDEIDVFDCTPAEGVEQLAWGMKAIGEQLRGKVVELGLDATYNTNNKHLELYCFMGELDGAGYPLSYCLLSTASSIEIGKRTKALLAWAECLTKQYGVDPKFFHCDKDMAGIAMARQAWLGAKIQLCWWHLRRFLRQRLSQSKLATTPYNSRRAYREFQWIDVNWTPEGQPDTTEYEGGCADEDEISAEDEISPNAILLRIPATQYKTRSQTRNSSTPEPTTQTTEPPLTIKIPAMPSEGTRPAYKRVFCPEELRESIVNMAERHFCAHPLIPGFSHPSPKGIREWAAKQMYSFCVKHDLQEVWAYLWENWYRPGRWELWARAPYPLIPRLKTTMMLESHWRRIKKDFLHHFHLPRADLLVWILITKLAPTYYRKLQVRLTDIGRYRELPDWRKAFKREWNRCLRAEVSAPLNPQYRPDPLRWICTCPCFVKSRFLVCKHLVHCVEHVPPVFFLEVQRNRTTPFWSHSSLKPLAEFTNSSSPQETLPLPPSGCDRDDDASSNSDEPPDIDVDEDSVSDHGNLVDLGQSSTDLRTNKERLSNIIEIIENFTSGLKYQVQFNDHRFLQALERDGAGFLRLARNCLDVERRFQSTRVPAPNTWESSTSNAMYYRARPSRSEEGEA